MNHSMVTRTLSFLVCSLILLRPALAIADQKKGDSNRSPASSILTADPELRNALLPHTAGSRGRQELDLISDTGARKAAKYNRPLQTTSRYVYSSNMPPMYLAK